MNGSVLVSYAEVRDVFIDNTKCGFTNEPFDVQTGTHDIDLGDPVDYAPPTKQIKVKSTHTPLAPLVVKFTPKDEVL